MPGPLQQGGTPEAHQAGLLQSSRWAAGVRARLQWLTVMVAGMQRPPALAAMRWWTSRGRLASHRREQITTLLSQCAEGWQRRVVHVFDRGFAGAPWLRELSANQMRFVMRWPTRYRLSDEKGERPAWHITRGKRSFDHRQIWDTRRRQYRKTGIVAVPVSHPQVDGELWLVVSRPGKGRTPWYLLTNEPIATNEDAWRVVMTYARRWQVELCYRACKTDLAMESPGSGSGKTGTNSCSWSPWSTPSCSPCWLLSWRPWSGTCSEAGATEQGSGTAKPRYRSQDSAPP